jgi:hypothetical protein
MYIYIYIEMYTYEALNSMKARALVVQRRRAELGPPEPNDEFPFPPEGLQCKFCRRSVSGKKPIPPHTRDKYEQT